MALPKRTKKKTVRASARVRRGDKLTAPSWEGWEEWSGQEFHRHRDKSREFYYQNYKPVDLFPHTYKWMASNDYSKEDIKNAAFLMNYRTAGYCKTTTRRYADTLKKKINAGIILLGNG